MEIVAGVDEAGRGCLAGPVVAGAVILPDEYEIPVLRDSKKMTARQRDRAFDAIKDQAVDWAVGFVDNRTIDKINILQATYKAMQIALGKLKVKPDKALIDGSELPNQIIPNEGIIDGDDSVPCIQAAAIMAKVSRDRWMEKLDSIFPEFQFGKHKGYGTQYHFQVLNKFKATPLHRISFRPVHDNLPTIPWLEAEKKIGWMGEKLAALDLMEKGYEILTMNYSSLPYGELDIVAQQKDTRVFIEVKSASRMNTDILTQKIDAQKLERLYNAVDIYTQREEWEGNIRLDAMFVEIRRGGPRIKHYEAIGGSE